MEHFHHTVRNLVRVALFGTLLPCAVAADGLLHWPAVSDAQLGQLRGGLSIGPLVASFAIERVIRIDGQIVTRTLLVVDFANVAKGGMPTLQVIGDLANLIQVGPGNSAAGVDASQLAVTAARAINETMTAPMTDAGGTAGFVETATQAAESLGLQVSANSSSSTVTAASGVTSDSQAQFGSALGQAVDVATSTAQVPALATPAPTATAATTVTSATEATTVTAAAPVAPAAPVQPAAQTVQLDAPATSTIVKPLGNTGSVIVISNIPNATALATAIQNSVAQTHVEAQTTISATLNSLAPLLSGAFANSLQQQILQSNGRP